MLRLNNVLLSASVTQCHAGESVRISAHDFYRLLSRILISPHVTRAFDLREKKLGAFPRTS